jgi:hypothetical protein
MRWFRNGIAAVLASVALFITPGGIALCQARVDRLCRANCWYRVYYRVCPKNGWCYYATYRDCHRAQQVVDYLHFEGCEAYYRAIATEVGT